MIIEEIYNKRLSRQVRVGDIYVGPGPQMGKVASGRVSAVTGIEGINVSFPVVYAPIEIYDHLALGGTDEMEYALLNLEEAIFIRFKGWMIEKILVGQKIIGNVDDIWQK